MRTFTLLYLIFAFFLGLWAQNPDPLHLKQQIESWKNDTRGPYLDIRWFCPDGTTRTAKDPCPDDEGVQRARYKAEVIKLGTEQQLYFGQILAATPNKDFWDVTHQHNRFKQYQLEKYLRQIDDGWVLRKAQYYRGAFQAEDESAWGKAFLQDLLKDPNVRQKEYFLLYQAFMSLPHGDDSGRLQSIRSLSKTIADSYTSFQDIRIKIHGQPGPEDIATVEQFVNAHTAKLSPENQKRFQQLLAEMRLEYATPKVVDWLQAGGLKSTHPFRQSWSEKLALLDLEGNPAASLPLMADYLWELRMECLARTTVAERYFCLELSQQMSRQFFRSAMAWEPLSLQGLLLKANALSKGVAATGLLEVWEWERLSAGLTLPKGQLMTLGALNHYQLHSRRVVEWGSGMIRAHYQGLVNRFEAFEPLAGGFIDDRIRASLLLPLGNTVGQMSTVLAQQAQLGNSVLKLSDPDRFRGLNPGYALGELVVVEGDPEGQEVDASKIYVFQRPPSDMKPVAGILTVSEGNLVSHVQLLARNLGIPNAVLGQEDLRELKPYHGKKVFYAVSNRGTVIMKEAGSMTEAEKALFTEAKRKEEKVRIPTDQLILDQHAILNMRSVDARSSGIVCGPKAANLGQLKKLYPEQVVEGLVIPFGIFLQHLEQPMPGENCSYWAFLQGTFEEAGRLTEKGMSKDEVDQYVLSELSSLRNAIKEMKLLPAFEAELDVVFREVLGGGMGKVPVFLRSDTNMEDLKEFTGAGLNLTLFNVLDRNKILQGIKDVWASPYTERSYRWRQVYLLNPENVYPSILIIPSVNNDYSGVLITKGIQNDEPKDMTIAFSRGVGGAVDGQLAETYLLEAEGGEELLNPARELQYTVLPASGGTAKNSTDLSRPILNANNLTEIRAFTEDLRQQMREHTQAEGPWDVEMGFQNDKLWLFQVRPFVENKKAQSSEYLQSISPAMNLNKLLPLALSLRK